MKQIGIVCAEDAKRKGFDWHSYCRTSPSDQVVFSVELYTPVLASKTIGLLFKIPAVQSSGKVHFANV